MLSPAHPYWCHHSNYTWIRVKVMKLFIMQFSPTFYNFVPLRSKYSAQHPMVRMNEAEERKNKRNWKRKGKNKIRDIFIYFHYNWSAP
jgi:hypothetical protein